MLNKSPVKKNFSFSLQNEKIQKSVSIKLMYLYSFKSIIKIQLIPPTNKNFSLNLNKMLCQNEISMLLIV